MKMTILLFKYCSSYYKNTGITEILIDNQNNLAIEYNPLSESKQVQNSLL